MEVLEERETSHVIIQHLKATGIRIKRWKASLSEQQEKSAPPRVGLFGIPLQELPVSERDGSVPQFLVDACHFLSQHLHTEGLFRKPGSMTRIKALKVMLESGESCWDSAVPCDVASLLKQFLRDLPDPLIMTELQEPLCRLQQLAGEGERGPITALITCLLPRLNACTLRYFCIFLQTVAARCKENKMDLVNLAVVFAPNLFCNLELSEKLTGMTERQLQLQAAVVQTLVTHASEIGRLPQFILEKLRPLPDAASVCRTPASDECGEDLPNGRGGGRRRRRRQSMGELVNGALSKLMTGRTPSSTPLPDRKPAAVAPEPSPTLSTSFKTKRKVSEDAAQGPEVSAKKRKPSLEPVADEITTDHVLGFILASSVPSTPCRSIQMFSQNPASPEEGLEQSFVVLSLPATPHQHPASSTKRRRSKRPEGKRVQRKHSGRNSCASPIIIDRKDQVRKSLRIFQRPVKPQTPLYPLVSDAKTLEPSGWHLMKRMMAEAFEGPIFTGRDVRSTSKTDELPNGVACKSAFGDTLSKSSSVGEEATADGIQRLVTPETGRKNRKNSPSCLVSAVELPSPPTWRRWFTAREQNSLSQVSMANWKTGGLSRDSKLSGVQGLQEKSTKAHPLRRSLSLPENVKETLEDEPSEALQDSVLESPVFQENWGCRGSPRYGTTFSNADKADDQLTEDAEAAVPFRGRCSCTDVETPHSVHLCRELGVPLVHVTSPEQRSPMDSDSGILEDGDVAPPQPSGGVGQHTDTKVLERPPTSMEHPLATHISEVHHITSLHMLSEQDALSSAIQNLNLNFHHPLIDPSMTPPETKDMEEGQPMLRRRGARRFGRSLSCESALALKAEAARELDTDGMIEGPEAEEAAEPLLKGSPSPRRSKSPQKLLRNCSHQIFISRKHITLTFGGHRDRMPAAEVLANNPSPQKPTTFDPENVAAGSENPDSASSFSEAAFCDSLAQQFVQAERRTYRRSPKHPLLSSHFLRTDNCLDL